MGYTYKIVEKEKYILCVMRGEVYTAEDMISCGERIVPEVRQRGYDALILDDTRFRIQLSPLDVTLFAEHMAGLDFARMGLRVGVVFPPENEEIIGFFETAMRNRSVNFNVFSDMAQAQEWIKE